tara:strand:+ start:1150 stop:2028 length:879 start_codon:yes stop_codon:yes gene_type:complete
MNYGEEFIKLYNKELSSFKKELIIRIEKDYNSPEMDNDLLYKYKSEIQGDLNEIIQNDNKGETSSGITDISLGFMNKNYKSNRIENIINIDIYNYFVDHQKYSQYTDFKNFIEIYSKFLVAFTFRGFMTDYSKQFCKLLSKKEIESFFNIKNIKDDLNLLDPYFGNKKKELQNESKELLSKRIELEDNEKSILLNILFFHLKDSTTKKIPLTEKYRLLILCSSVLKEEDFFKIKTGFKTFDYFKHGINKTRKFKGEKRIMIENIINKLEKLDGLKEVINSINILKNQDSFYS